MSETLFRPPLLGDPGISECPWHFRHVEDGKTYQPCLVPIQGGPSGLAKHVAVIHKGRWPSAANTM